MATEDVKKFREFAAGDAKAFQDELDAELETIDDSNDGGQNRNFQALINVGARHGYHFTVDDLKAVAADTELSDAELEHIAGGANS